MRSLGTAFALALLVAPGLAVAQPLGMTPLEASTSAPAGAVEIPLYGKANPGHVSDVIETQFMQRETVLRNITYPTLTPVLPDPARATGTAVIVAPGGGFRMLAMQNEGWRVARALADRGIAAFVLKYRLLPTAKADAEFYADMGRMMQSAIATKGSAADLQDPAATLDALAALRMIRARAAEWHIAPDRVGMIGFSAGAMTTLRAVLEAKAGSDPTARGPDFIGYIYGPMTTVAVPADAPPMFAALAMDDPLFGNSDWSIASAWHAAKRPVELHVYQSGGHGFGMGKPGTTNALIMQEFLAWMDMQGLLTPKVRP